MTKTLSCNIFGHFGTLSKMRDLDNIFVVFLTICTVSVSVMSHVTMILTSFSLTGIFWVKLGFGSRVIV